MRSVNRLAKGSTAYRSPLTGHPPITNHQKKKGEPKLPLSRFCFRSRSLVTLDLTDDAGAVQTRATVDIKLDG